VREIPGVELPHAQEQRDGLLPAGNQLLVNVGDAQLQPFKKG
jgi:hypothetical protein